MTNPVSNAYLKSSTRKEEDKILREFLESTTATIKIDDGDETYFRYWTDEDLKIRTCLECQISEFKSPEDGQWIIYFPNERIIWACQQIQKENYELKCSVCEKWNNRWRRK